MLTRRSHASASLALLLAAALTLNYGRTVLRGGRLGADGSFVGQSALITDQLSEHRGERPNGQSSGGAEGSRGSTVTPPFPFLLPTLHPETHCHG